LKLGPVCRLRALAFFSESLEDLVSLAAAVRLASAQLSRETEVLGLLPGTHADVDDGARQGFMIAPTSEGGVQAIGRFTEKDGVHLVTFESKGRGRVSGVVLRRRRGALVGNAQEKGSVSRTEAQ
jgi:hypothetical protein